MNYHDVLPQPPPQMCQVDRATKAHLHYRTRCPLRQRLKRGNRLGDDQRKNCPTNSTTLHDQHRARHEQPYETLPWHYRGQRDSPPCKEPSQKQPPRHQRRLVP